MTQSVYESDGCVMGIWAYHVEERCIGKEGSSPEFASVHGRFKICGHRSGDADGRLHDGSKA